MLVVQGVAGSGKTSVALHRLSYLVYPDLAAGRVAPRCLVFGPNQLFLKYISSVLPQARPAPRGADHDRRLGPGPPRAGADEPPPAPGGCA